MAITTRSGKGSALTHTEMDTNFKQIPNGSDSSITDTGTKIGIGTSSPNAKLEVASTSATARATSSTESGVYSYQPHPHELAIENNQANTNGSFTGIFFKAGDSGSGANTCAARISAVKVGSKNTDLTFSTRDSTSNTTAERMRILSSGGITFNGDTASANALDDYEEGTWTPDNKTSGTANGAYTKIGNMVFCTLEFGSVTLSDATSGGLPYAMVGGYGTSMTVYITGFGTPGAGKVLAPAITGNTIYWRSYNQTTGSYGTITDLTGDGRFSFMYRTNS